MTAHFFWIGCILYLLSDLLFQPVSSQPKTSNRNHRSSLSLKLFMFLHNIVLCIFSVLCFLNTAPVVWELLTHEKGWQYSTQYGWNDKVNFVEYCILLLFVFVFVLCLVLSCLCVN